MSNFEEDETARAVKTLSSTPSEKALQFYDYMAFRMAAEKVRKEMEEFDEYIKRTSSKE
ncbi:hypothetical protein D3C87_278910 [compost metagenome]